MPTNNTGRPLKFDAVSRSDGHFSRQLGQSSSKNHNTTPFPLRFSIESGGAFIHDSGDEGSTSPPGADCCAFAGEQNDKLHARDAAKHADAIRENRTRERNMRTPYL